MTFLGRKRLFSSSESDHRLCPRIAQRNHPRSFPGHTRSVERDMLKRQRCLLVIAGCLCWLDACGEMNARAPLLLATGAPPAGQAGVAYAGFYFRVASGGLAPFHWSEAGPLPPGLSLNAAGALLGNPTEAGTFPIAVTVTDSSFPPQTASTKLTLVIDKGFFPPPLRITCGSPPTGISGSEYDATTNGFSLTASGGVPPYVWLWAASSGSSLPPGLSLSTNVDGTGTISGIPTVAGNYTVVITAVDSNSPVATVSKTFSIIISTPIAQAVPERVTPLTEHRRHQEHLRGWRLEVGLDVG